jgi:DNA-binding MarR family transcriptional regulator
MAVRSTARIANEAWEALYRAQATVAQSLSAETEWSELAPREYGVLYALSTAPEGLRISELGEDVLLTQPGMSRLVARLDARGLVERASDPGDARACRIGLTASGSEVQRRVGLSHARRVSAALTRTLDRRQLMQLRDLCRDLTAGPSQADQNGADGGPARAGAAS